MMKFELASSPVSGSGTAMTIDISSAPVGSHVFVWALSGSNSNTITATGWSIEQNRSAGVGAMKCMLLYRQKQSGDTTFSTPWGTSSSWIHSWVAYSGIKSFSTEAVFLSKNTAGAELPTNSISYQSGTWAIGFFASIQTVNTVTWTPDAAMTERVDAVRSTSSFMAMNITDTNGPVNASSKSFLSTSSQSFTYGLAGVVQAVPDGIITGWGLPI